MKSVLWDINNDKLIMEASNLNEGGSMHVVQEL